jgi:hypothetical protein
MLERHRAQGLLGSGFEAFYPWIGESFDPSCGVMLVGESHFDEESSCERLQTPSERFETIDLIAGRPDWTMKDEKKFILRAEAFLYHLNSQRGPIVDVWRHVSFYNFCNKYMPFESNKSHKPSEDTLKASMESFRRVVEAVRPRWIIVSSFLAFDRIMHYSNIRKKLLRERIVRADKAIIDLSIEHEIIPIRHLSRSSPENTAKTVRQLMIAGFSHKEPN